MNAHIKCLRDETRAIRTCHDTASKKYQYQPVFLVPVRAEDYARIHARSLYINPADQVNPGVLRGVRVLQD